MPAESVPCDQDNNSGPPSLFSCPLWSTTASQLVLTEWFFCLSCIRCSCPSGFQRPHAGVCEMSHGPSPGGPSPPTPHLAPAAHSGLGSRVAQPRSPLLLPPAGVPRFKCPGQPVQSCPGWGGAAPLHQPSRALGPRAPALPSRKAPPWRFLCLWPACGLGCRDRVSAPLLLFVVLPENVHLGPRT